MYHPNAQRGTNLCGNKKINNCNHLCFGITKSEYSCKCAIGYRPSPHEHNKCLGEEEFILYSVSHELRGLALYESEENEGVLAPISRISLATNIDYHYKNDLLFWADSDKGKITSIKRDGTQRRVIVNQTDQYENAAGGDWLGGIAVDWVADNIYWSDEKRNLIEVARLDGSCRYVVASFVEKPKAIAVDPADGLLFYIGDKRIGRIGLDGSQHFILVNQTTQITNMVLDINDQKVYWCESSTDTIWHVDYDGNSKGILLNHSLENPIALALYNKSIYWADNSHSRGSIKMAPVTNLSDFTTLTTNEGSSLNDLKIFSPDVQTGNNSCLENNGGCQELCLFNGSHPVCACSHGQISATNGKMCDNYDEFLIYSCVTSIESIHLTDPMNVNGPIATISHPKLLRNTIGLSFDYERSRIFYSDIHSSSINSVYFNGTDHRIIVNKQLSVEGLAYEPIKNQLFWTSNSDASIRAVNLTMIGSNYENNTDLVKRVIELSAHDKPRGIAVESCLGMVYWTNWNPQAASIQRAFITGYGLESIITKDIRMPNAITIDYENHVLYWADARLDKIERADYDGSHRVVLAHSTPKHPFALAVYNNYLYWTDWVLHAVLRANKFSGADVAWLRKDVGRLMGIVAVQNTTRSCSASPCDVLNGQCEDVCDVVAGNVKCECTQGRLASDGKRCLPSGQCQPGQFMCTSKDCIPFHLTCDTIKHCIDGSDEDIGFCNYRQCPSQYFMCNNHRCIPTSQTCDGIEHCGDGSDEAVCNCTTDLHFKCNSGQCIDKKYRCDRDPDCPDASDEMNCPDFECVSSQSDTNSTAFIKCENTTMCYMESWRCDGNVFYFYSLNGLNIFIMTLKCLQVTMIAGIEVMK